MRDGVKLVTPERVYSYIVEFFRENDQLPTSADVGRAFGVTDKTANEHFQRLAEAGYIEKNSVRKYRFGRIT